MPLEKWGLAKKRLPLNLTHAEREAKVKELVKDELPLSGTLMQHSGGEYTYDCNGPWIISEETSGTDPTAGRAESTLRWIGV